LSETSQLLQQLFQALEERDPLHDGAVDDSDGSLLACLNALRLAVKQPLRTQPAAGVPPRRVAVAMALALHSQPHLATTLKGTLNAGTMNVNDRERPPFQAPILASNEVLETTLGLSEWELDELREDIDRRASDTLKQCRCLEHLWTYFELPEGNIDLLFRVLFPGALRSRARPEFLRRGAQLYAIVEQDPAPPLLSLFLPWLPVDQQSTLPPLSTFNHRSVDVGFRRSLSRSIGADMEEVDTLLNRMVTILPKDKSGAYVDHDRWRSSGFATIADLGQEYGSANWLTGNVLPDGAEWRRWLRAKDGHLEILGEARALFDALAMRRVQTMMRQLYAALIASIDCEDESTEPGLQDLQLYDVGRHLRRVIAPLLDWVGANATHRHIAGNLNLDLESVTTKMKEIQHVWANQASRAWYGAPTEARTHSIQTILASHLIALHGSLRAMIRRTADNRRDHRSILLFFAAHYLGEARIERLWLKGLSDSIIEDSEPLPPPEDIIGTWFWCTWMRLLDELVHDSSPSM